MYSELKYSILTECEWCNTRYRIESSNNIEIGLTKARCKKCNKIFTISLANGNDFFQQEPKDGQKRTSTFKDSRSVQNIDNKDTRNEWKLTVHENANEKAKSIPKNNNNVKFGIRKKFNTALVSIMIVSLCGTYVATNYLFKQSAERSARFLMNTMEASRAFTGEVLKPVLYKALPGRFIVEGMSSSFGARNLFERINKKYPDYYFKHAAPNPRNKLNLADAFEQKIIKKFNDNRNLKEWYGYRESGAGKDFVIMKPIVAEERCMKCHSVPSKAPVEIIEKYGDKAAFGMVVGDVIAALTVSAPATKIFAKSRNNTIIVNTIIALCFIFLIAMINIFFAKIVIEPIQRLKQSVNEISIGNLDVPINSNGNDEISDLALSFERMQVSICMAMQRFNRIRKEQRRLQNPSNS